MGPPPAECKCLESLVWWRPEPSLRTLQVQNEKKPLGGLALRPEPCRAQSGLWRLMEEPGPPGLLGVGTVTSLGTQQMDEAGG